MFSPQHLASSNGALPPTSTNKSIADISGSQAPHPLPATRSLVNNIIMIVIIAIVIVIFKSRSIVDIISEFNARSEMAPDWGSLRR